MYCNRAIDLLFLVYIILSFCRVSVITVSLLVRLVKFPKTHSYNSPNEGQWALHIFGVLVGLSV